MDLGDRKIINVENRCAIRVMRGFAEEHEFSFMVIERKFVCFEPGGDIGEFCIHDV